MVQLFKSLIGMVQMHSILKSRKIKMVIIQLKMLDLTYTWVLLQIGIRWEIQIV